MFQFVYLRQAALVNGIAAINSNKKKLSYFFCFLKYNAHICVSFKTKEIKALIFLKSLIQNSVNLSGKQQAKDFFG